MEVESRLEDPIAMVRGRDDRGVVAAAAQLEPERDDRMQIAERAERREENSHERRALGLADGDQRGTQHLVADPVAVRDDAERPGRRCVVGRRAPW